MSTLNVATEARSAPSTIARRIVSVFEPLRHLLIDARRRRMKAEMLGGMSRKALQDIGLDRTEVILAPQVTAQRCSDYAA